MDFYAQLQAKRDVTGCAQHEPMSAQRHGVPQRARDRKGKRAFSRILHRNGRDQVFNLARYGQRIFNWNRWPAAAQASGVQGAKPTESASGTHFVANDAKQVDMLLHAASDQLRDRLQFLVPAAFDEVILDAEKLLMTIGLGLEISLVEPLASKLAKVARHFPPLFTRLRRGSPSERLKYAGNGLLFSDFVPGKPLDPAEMAALLRQARGRERDTPNCERILDISFGDFLQPLFASAPGLRESDRRRDGTQGEQ
jgi:hypothetical protein